MEEVTLALPPEKWGVKQITGGDMEKMMLIRQRAKGMAAAAWCSRRGEREALCGSGAVDVSRGRLWGLPGPAPPTPGLVWPLSAPGAALAAEGDIWWLMATAARLRSSLLQSPGRSCHTHLSPPLGGLSLGNLGADRENEGPGVQEAKATTSSPPDSAFPHCPQLYYVHACSLGHWCGQGFPSGAFTGNCCATGWCSIALANTHPHWSQHAGALTYTCVLTLTQELIVTHGVTHYMPILVYAYSWTHTWDHAHVLTHRLTYNTSMHLFTFIGIQIIVDSCSHTLLTCLRVGTHMGMSGTLRGTTRCCRCLCQRPWWQKS